jgi:hypothetical protein
MAWANLTGHGAGMGAVGLQALSGIRLEALLALVCRPRGPNENAACVAGGFREAIEAQNAPVGFVDGFSRFRRRRAAMFFDMCVNGVLYFVVVLNVMLFSQFRRFFLSEISTKVRAAAGMRKQSAGVQLGHFIAPRMRALKNKPFDAVT